MGGLPTRRTVNGFAAHPSDPEVMYAAMRDGLFTSTDAGERWSAVRSAPKGLAAIAVHPQRAAELYLATVPGVIWTSRDTGATWKRAP